MLTISAQRLSSVRIIHISAHTNTNSNIRDQHFHLTYTSSYLQTEIKLVCPLPRTIRTTHLSFTLHIQFPAFSQVCQLFGCLFWWACKLFPGRKRAACALTSRACVHMITARQADNMVVVVSRDFRRAQFSILIDCRTLLWDSYEYQFESKGLLQHFVRWRRIFPHFQGEKKEISVGIRLANDERSCICFVNIGSTSFLWLRMVTSDWPTSIESFFYFIVWYSQQNQAFLSLSQTLRAFISANTINVSVKCLGSEIILFSVESHLHSRVLRQSKAPNAEYLSNIPLIEEKLFSYFLNSTVCNDSN